MKGDIKLGKKKKIFKCLDWLALVDALLYYGGMDWVYELISEQLGRKKYGVLCGDTRKP